jgi:hypothetical protein
VTGYSSFFDQSAEIAGTLIGLLFVEIALSPNDRQAVPFRVHTTAAFTALIDSLAVSLTALLPGDGTGTAALAASIAGLSSTATGLTVLSIQRWPGRRYLRDLVSIRDALDRLPGEARDESVAFNTMGDNQARLEDIGQGRIEAMDAAGIDMSVLSVVTPAAQALPAREAVVLARDANDEATDAVRAHPARFRAFATISR